MIESELCLLQMQEELLSADTLELGESVFGVAPEGFDSVDVVFFDGEFVVCVTYSEVLSESDINQPVVANPTIAMNHRVQGDLSANQPLQGSFLGVWHNLSPHLIAAFQDAEDDGLVASSTSAFSLDPVRAEIRFVDFDDSAERGIGVGDGSEASAQLDENVVHRTNRHTGHPRRRTGRKVLSEASENLPEFGLSDFRRSVVPVNPFHYRSINPSQSCFASYVPFEFLILNFHHTVSIYACDAIHN